ncbi:hypothetical protein Tco_0055608 [Tanacetum coccineum]
MERKMFIIRWKVSYDQCGYKQSTNSLYVHIQSSKEGNSQLERCHRNFLWAGDTRKRKMLLKLSSIEIKVHMEDEVWWTPASNGKYLAAQATQMDQELFPSNNALWVSQICSIKAYTIDMTRSMVPIPAFQSGG